MDDIVLRSMLKWPDVPSVYGWLRLDRRGRWLIRLPDPTGGGGGGRRFERITHAAMIEFIGRNYAQDAQGRWFFQNGPQRVFVALEYTPWVYSLDGAGLGLVAHTGVAAGAPRGAYFDEQGGLILECGLGIGAVLDRDLASLEARFLDDAGRPLDCEALIERARTGAAATARMFGAQVAVGAMRSADVAARFGFIPDPRPPEGQPDC